MLNIRKITHLQFYIKSVSINKNVYVKTNLHVGLEYCVFYVFFEVMHISLIEENSNIEIQYLIQTIRVNLIDDCLRLSDYHKGKKPCELMTRLMTHFTFVARTNCFEAQIKFDGK